MEPARCRKPNIREVVSPHVELRKVGRRWWGLCPFHSEKTPSFCVDEDKGRYHCFGCNGSGDVFDFIQQLEGIGFREAKARLGVADEYRPRPIDTYKRDAAALLDWWLTAQREKAGALLRQLTRCLVIAEETNPAELIKRHQAQFQREFDLLETLFDDLHDPACAWELFESRDSIEHILEKAPIEPFEYPEYLTPESEGGQCRAD
jgi:hypothetical protein